MAASTVDSDSTHTRRDRLICLLLVVVTLALYWPATGFEFNNYDDAQYITKNPRIQSGLSTESMRWAFQSGYAGNWHPLTWLSHMVDCQLYGLKPGGHHFTNLLFHLANTVLLFGWLRQLTGAVWRAAFVAALFAWHPTHVESVAWVAERKDVLSTFFGLSTLWAYWYYVKVPNWPRYGLVLLSFALGLMAKPMLVTLPLVLMLLDYWPLRRVQLFPLQPISAYIPLLREKLPLFALAAASSYVTFWVQKSGGAMMLTNLSLTDRVANALNSYVCYIGKILWPRHLAVLYPYHHSLPLGQVIAAGTLVFALSVLACGYARSRPHLVVGWFWFLITLVPVIGLVQVGEQSLADRYLYIPSIGLFLLLVWEAPQLLGSSPFAKAALGIVATSALVGCLITTSLQLPHWRNSITLFTQAIQVTTDNAVAHCNLGEALAVEGKQEEALAHFDEALRIRPNYLVALNNKGALFLKQGRFDEAITQFNSALKLLPGYYLAHNNLGQALLKQEKVEAAIAHFRAAVQSNPAYVEAFINLGLALARQGKLDEAITQYRNALLLAPNPYAENGLGGALDTQGKLEEAAMHYAAALKLKPDFAEAHNNLGAILIVQGKFAEAGEHFAAALQIQPDFAAAHYNLGNALLSQGKLAEAASRYSEAVRLQPDYMEAHFNLANVLTEQKHWDAASGHYAEALRLRPDFADAHINLGVVLAQQGNRTGAIEHYRAALHLDPRAPQGLKKLAWILATDSDPKLRNGEEAVRLATLATQLAAPTDATAWDTQAAAYAETGQFAEAVNAAKKALGLATASQNKELVAQIQNRLRLYEAGQAFHEASVTVAGK